MSLPIRMVVAVRLVKGVLSIVIAWLSYAIETQNYRFRESSV